MKVKKAHEISRIVPYLDHKKDQFKKFIDVGGGVGHLSRTTAQKLNKLGTCIELNPDFVQSGKRIMKLQNDQCFEYKNVAFQEFLNEKTEETDKTLLMGLHACGPLE